MRRSLKAKKSMSAAEDGVPDVPVSKKSKMNLREELPPSSGTQIHPLLIDHIVEQVFDHLMKNASSKSDLLSCRRVCKLWNKTGTELYRKLEADREITFSFGDTEKLTRFLKAMKNTACLPFQKFRFDVNFFVPENRDSFPSFLSTCGPFITSLVLCFGKDFSISTDLRKFRNINLSSLKSLTFQTTYLNTMRAKEGRRNAWNPPDLNQYEGLHHLLQGILTSAQELEELDFSVFAIQLSEVDCKKFGMSLASSLPPTVKRLKLILEIGAEELEGLAKRNLKLEELTVNFYGSVTPKESIVDFLDSQKGTLTSLSITDLKGTYAEDFGYPVFNKMDSLEIKCGNNSTFKYLKSFPCLNKLTLRNGRRNGNDLADDASALIFNENQDWRFPTVEEVELAQENKNMSPLVRRLAKICPNLKKFKIKISTDSLPALGTVFEEMRTLEVLDVEFPQFFENLAVDTVFTGIPIENCRDMLERKSFHPSDIEGVVRKANLADLTTCSNFEMSFANPAAFLLRSQQKKLSTVYEFCVCSWNGNGSSELKKLAIRAASYAVVISNVTAAFGLLQNPSLKELEIMQLNITRDFFQRLKTRFIVTEAADVKESLFTAIQNRHPYFTPLLIIDRLDDL